MFSHHNRYHNHSNNHSSNRNTNSNHIAIYTSTCLKLVSADIDSGIEPVKELEDRNKYLAVHTRKTC